ncbi:MAG: HNH endonuclease [Rhodospirillales bacterium]|jgi:putative restriction endonuclease|nr:HNH endonuclease [Rhodospirillales bacterium]
MTKAVFMTRADPTYDDLPEIRYHFPRTYLGAAERAIGDWIVYYEPRRIGSDPGSHGGRQAYFATARVTAVEPDPTTPDHFYAFVTDYLELDRAVPFREGQHYYEDALRRDDGGTSKGAFGRSVRPLPDHEYDLILQAGFAPMLGRPAEAMGRYDIPGVAEEPATFERPVIESVVARPFRDAAFARRVKAAYDNTCAVTGIKMINGGGRAEVQAAHIRPVEANGPDSVRNGIALSGTIHWMFDRGLISLDDDYAILVARDRVPDTVARLIDGEGRLRLPPRPDLWPHPQFIRYHRDVVFKG